jgi:NADPH:quinone reductase-like Zn-dependent oxidoreductase
MRAIEAETFSGYGGLRQIEFIKPRPTKGRVLVRVTAAGVTPLDHTILSGEHPRAKAPLVLGNEGTGVIEDAGGSELAVGSRVMFTGPYGVAESGAWQDWLLVRPEHLALVPDVIDDVVAASLPVAYLTAQVTLTLAGFKPGMTVLAPGIGGSVGNATYQLARAQGAGKVISTAGSAAKATRARELGFEDVVDLTTEGLAEGARRITAGNGVDIAIDSIGGTVTSEAQPLGRWRRFKIPMKTNVKVTTLLHGLMLAAAVVGPAAADPTNGFPPLGDGQARVVIYRPIEFYETHKPARIFVDGQLLARTETGAFTYCDLPAGSHVFSVQEKIPTPEQEQTIALAPRQVIYLTIATGQNPGGMYHEDWIYALRLVDPSVAQPVLAGLTPLDRGIGGKALKETAAVPAGAH